MFQKGQNPGDRAYAATYALQPMLHYYPITGALAFLLCWSLHRRTERYAIYGNRHATPPVPRCDE